MEIKELMEGSCIIIKNNGKETLLGIVEKIIRSHNGAEIRACDDTNRHYNIHLYIED